MRVAQRIPSSLFVRAYRLGAASARRRVVSMQLDTASFRNTAAPARVRSYRDTPARWTQDVRRDPGTDARRQAAEREQAVQW